MSLTNLFRDQIHISPGKTAYGFSIKRNIGDKWRMNSSGIVNQTFGSTQNPYTIPPTTTGVEWSGVGVLMSPPIVDSTPYRIKATVTSRDANIYIVAGYAPSAPTGLDDQIIEVVQWPVASIDGGGNAKFDDVILVPGLNELDPNYNRAIAIGIGISKSGASSVTAFNLSVQNLSKTAPQFAASMS